MAACETTLGLMAARPRSVGCRPPHLPSVVPSPGCRLVGRSLAALHGSGSGRSAQNERRHDCAKRFRRMVHPRARHPADHVSFRTIMFDATAAAMSTLDASPNVSGTSSRLVSKDGASGPPARSGQDAFVALACTPTSAVSPQLTQHIGTAVRHAARPAWQGTDWQATGSE